jgi:hypothetical protein
MYQRLERTEGQSAMTLSPSTPSDCSLCSKVEMEVGGELSLASERDDKNTEKVRGAGRGGLERNGLEGSSLEKQVTYTWTSNSEIARERRNGIVKKLKSPPSRTTSEGGCE